jgi:acetyl esterase/lipase
LITASLLCIATLAQAGVAVKKDVTYGHVTGVDLNLDVYQPDIPGAHPAVIAIHGGGWSGGDKGWYTVFGKRMAADGFVVFSINYRLAPRFPYPAQINDCQRAVRWVRAHATDYSVDPERIGAIGDSAGGYLVSVLGTEDTRDNSDADLAMYSSRVSAVVDLYGPADFTVPPSSASTAGLNILRSYFGKEPTSDPQMLKEASPAQHVDSKSAKFLILHGTADTLVPIDQSVRMATALKSAGVSVLLMELYGLPHGFFVPIGAPPPEPMAAVQEFLTRTLVPK